MVRTKIRNAVFLLSSAALSQSVFGMEQDIPFLAEIPVIDGNAADDCWKSLPWNGRFRKLGVKDLPAAVQTRFKIGHDGNFLYLLAEASELQPERIRKLRAERDSDVWNDDCIEILIDPNRSHDRFYHLAISSRNVLFDEERLQGGILASPAWNCIGIKSAVNVGMKQWTLEAAIPLLTLGIERTDGKMAFNIARERYTDVKPEISAFHPAGSGLLCPSDFKDCRLLGGNLKKYAWKIRGPYDARTLSRDGKIYFEGKIHITNDTGSLHRGFLLHQLGMGKTKSRVLIMDSGVANEYDFSLEANSVPSSQIFAVELTALDGTPLCQRSVPVQIQYSPLQADLTNPPYRDNIYSDMKLIELTGLIRIHDVNAQNQKITISLWDSQKKKLAAIQIPAGRFALPIPPLKDGNYQLVFQAGNYRLEKKIRKLPYQRGEVRFDSNGIMRVDGQRFIPYGWFGCRDFERAARYGFNVIIEYAVTAFKGRNLTTLFDQLAANRMKGIIYCYPENRMYERKTQSLPLSKEEADRIRERIRELKHHPALLAWYLCDEPDLSPALPSRLREIHDLCAEEDPYHPTVILNNTAEGYRKYAQSGDITMPDIYPNFLKDGTSGNPMISVYNQLCSCAESGKRILWCTPQGFNYNDCGHPGQRIPTPEELRNMHYQSLLAGATGFIWYIYEYNYPYPEVFATVSSLLEETRKIAGCFFSPERRKMLTHPTTDVLAASYELPDGHRYILTVNTAYEARKITMSVPRGKYYLAGETGFRVSNGTLTDVLEKLQVRIYTTDPQVAQSFSVAESKKKAMAEREYLRKEGNLAYGPDGNVKITASGLHLTQLPLEHLIDGAYYDGFRIQRGKVSPEITLTFPNRIEASKLAFYGIDLIPGGEIEIRQSGQWKKVAELKANPAKPFATGPFSTFTELPVIGYRKNRDCLTAVWPSCSFTELRIKGFRGAKAVEVEIFQ